MTRIDYLIKQLQAKIDYDAKLPTERLLNPKLEHTTFITLPKKTQCKHS